MLKKKNDGRYRAMMTAVVAVILLATGLSAQQPGVVQPPAPQPAAPAKQPAADLSKQKAPNGLKWKNAPFDQVFNDYAILTERTLLIDPQAPKGGSITLVSTTELTMEEYLQAEEAVLAMNGIALLKVGDKFLKVIASKDARKEAMGLRVSDEAIKETDELISQVIRIKNIDIKEAEAAIKNFVHIYGNVLSFERTSTILLTDTAANVARVLEVLSMIDIPTVKSEEPYVIQIRFAKASDVKAKLEQIIAESQEEAKKSTVPRQAPSGPPGVITTPTVPGVIRPPKPVGAATPEERATSDVIEQAERGMIRGVVKIIADDRTNKLIIITRKENKRFFDDIIQVLDVETQPDVTVKIIRLEYAAAETVADTLNNLIGGKSSKPDDAKGVVSKPGDDPKATALKDVIAQKNEPKAPAVEQEKSRFGELSASNVKILPDKRTNSLLVMGRNQDLAAIEEIVKNMDMMLLQVMIETVIVQINLDDTVSSGIQWVQRALIAQEKSAAGGFKPVGGFASSAGSGTGALIPGLNSATALTSLGPWAESSGLSSYFTIFGLNLDAIVRLLKSESRNKIMSAPRLVTTDNTKAKLDSTEQRYFLKGNTVDQFGNVTPQTEIKDIGLTLEFTPHINKSRNVMLEIQQSISDVSGTQSVGSQGDWPVTQKRSFGASISVRDKETIVLGGLVRKTAGKQKTGVPFLSSIPIIGRLFGSVSDSEQQAEMVVFVTPYVLETPDEVAKVAEKHSETVGAKELWQSDWSGSKFAEPTKKDKAKLKTQAEAAKKSEEAKAPGAVPLVQQQGGRGNGVPDPDMAIFIKDREAQLGDKMKEVERSVGKDLQK